MKNTVADTVRAQMGILEEGFRLLGLQISSQQQAQFETYLRLLLDWNQKINLFSDHDTHRLAERHILESVAWTPSLRKQLSSPIMDLGSGAGFPGVPLAILRPDLRVVLVESKRKKSIFLRKVVQSLSLNTEVINQRIEDMAKDEEQTEKYPWVVARAVSNLLVLLDWSRPLLTNPGNLVSFKRETLKQEVKQLVQKESKCLKLNVNIIDYVMWENIHRNPQQVNKKMVKIHITSQENGNGQYTI